MLETLPPLVQSILYAILIGVGGALAAYLIYVLFARLTNRYIGSLLALLIIFGTLKWMLDVADAVGLIVILGTALTGALTLGMGDLAADLVSGAKLFATRPFRVGDTVSIAGHFGKVADTTLTNTVLQSNGGNQIIVRNSEVVAGTILNYSSGAREQRLEVQVTVPANQDLEKAVTAILEGTRDFAPQASAKVGVLCETVSDARMILKVYGFINGNQDMDAEKTRLMVATLKALKNHNVSL
ncbi:MAG TPA: mechanosensitive ion channel domain-containing protein [Anaerolineales bacterium]|nr:mechanosensitive ion channel domain-containing protein [Anaerolineales bacterium]